MPLYGHEIDEETNPFEAGLGCVVKLDKGEFIGHGALAQNAERASRKLVGFELTAGGVPRQGYPILDGDERRRAGDQRQRLAEPRHADRHGVRPDPPDRARAPRSPSRSAARPSRGSSPLPFYAHKTKKIAPSTARA